MDYHQRLFSEVYKSLLCHPTKYNGARSMSKAKRKAHMRLVKLARKSI